MQLEQARVRSSPNSTTRLLGVAGVDFPIFKDFGTNGSTSVALPFSSRLDNMCEMSNVAIIYRFQEVIRY